MKHNLIRDLKPFLCLGAMLSLAALCSPAQSRDASPSAPKTTSLAPVAWVYVASTPKNSNSNEILAYNASADGSLMPMAGSPFPENVQAMAVNGKYLMAAAKTGTDINAYLMGDNGGLAYQTATNYAPHNDPGADCGSAGPIFFDHTGATLYVMEYNGSSACANDIYASFEVVKSSGRLSYLGDAITGTFPGAYLPAYFIGDNVYAYSAENSGCMYYEIFGFERSSNGNLTNLGNVETNLPAPPPNVSRFVPGIAVADPTNHVAVAMQPANPPGCASGPIQLAAYTANSSGELSTTSTYETMPVSAVFSVYDMKMSPSGAVLTVGGQEGLQFFHFNGAHPITKYTGLVTTDPIRQMFWDNKNHLYAISQTDGKLFVYTVTPTSVRMAPGSPYTVSDPNNIIVQPLPR